MTIKEARENKGISRRQLSDWLGIPYRSLTNWELGERECPEYLANLIVEKIMRDGDELKRG